MLIEEVIGPVISEDWRKSIKTAYGAGALAAAASVGSQFVQSQQPTTPIHTPYKVSMEAPRRLSTRDILAMTIWGEARNQGEQGMEAVGHVILNRAESEHPSLFGNGVRGVSLQPKQFSFWNGVDPYEKEQDIRELIGPDKAMWEKAKHIATRLLKGETRDPTKGSLFYHTVDSKPFWSKHMQPKATIAGHVFYNNIPKKA